MTHLVVINPKSFNKQAEMQTVIRDIKSYLENQNKPHYIHVSRYPRDAIRVVKKYVMLAEGIVRVYSVGGDGILYDCLNGIRNLPNAQIAVIPYGTSCDFIRAFGEGKRGLFRDISKQVNAETIATDVLNIGNRYALNFCSVGVEAAVILKYYEICKKYPRISKQFGNSLYMAGIPLAFLDKKVTGQKYELTIDGVNHDGAYIGINFANGSCYGGNKTPFPMAHPADGKMEIMTLTGKITPKTFAAINSYTKGGYKKHPDLLSHMSAKNVKIRSNDPMHINVDGETYYGSELNIKLIPKAINFVSPDGISYVRRCSYDS